MIKVFDFETCKKIGAKLSSENFFDWVDFALKNKTDTIKRQYAQNSKVNINFLCYVLYGNGCTEEQKKELEADLEQAIQKGRRCGISDEDIKSLFELILEG